MLRFAILGCGGIAEIHAKAIARLEQEGIARLVAGGEPHPERRKTFGEKWGITMTPSLDELLKLKDVDAVTVCTLGGLHGVHSAQIARAGKHVICEKPLDTRIERAQQAIDAAKKAGVVLGGIFQQRFVPTVQKVKKLIDEGYFGRIIYAHCETPWYRPQAYYDQAGWRGTWDMDGGVLSNQAPHMIDRMTWLAGDVESVVSAVCYPGYLRKIEAETLAAATVKLKGDVLATITGTTLAYEGMPQRVMVCGTEGSVAFQGDDLVYFKTAKPVNDPDLKVLPAVQDDSARAAKPLALSEENHYRNIKDFALAIKEGRKPMVDAEESIKIVKVLNMIYEAAKVGPYADK